MVGHKDFPSQTLWYYGSMVLVGCVEQSRALLPCMLSASCSWCWVSWACFWSGLSTSCMRLHILHCVLDVIRSNVIIIYFGWGEAILCVLGMISRNLGISRSLGGQVQASHSCV